MRWALRALVALVCVAAPSTAWAEERISDFASRIAILKDGTLDVIERIDVNVEHNAINHGIYRDFPLRYDLPRGGRMRVGFKLVDATLDQQPVPASEESLGNGVRIKLGSAASLVPLGDHYYTIHYKVTRELGFFKDYDELYWNVTGNGWLFPIDHASATITLPSPAAFGQRSLYTGTQGATESKAQVVEEAPGLLKVETTSPLDPYEGLTVAAAFPKGVVDAPSAAQQRAWAAVDWLPIIVAVAGLAGLILYLFTLWARVGRDPPAGTIVPLFSPPDGLSPAAMRYVVRQEFDNRAFAAALVDAGVHGHVRLIEEKGPLFFGGKKFVEGLNAGSANGLDEAEQRSIAKLVQSGERLEFDDSNHAVFSAAKSVLADDCKQRFDGKVFKRNYEHAGRAVLLWFALAYLTATSIAVADGTGVTAFTFLPLVAFGISWFLWHLHSAQSGTKGCLIKLAAFVLAGAGCLMALGVIPAAFLSGRWQPILIIALGLPLALSSFAWIGAPTTEGRAMLDRIAGFKQYLGTTERERFDRMQQPNDTLTLFERFLPYAIALGVENRWADRFSAQLAAASVAGQQGFSWYSGPNSPWTNTGGFVSDIGSSLSSSISSASTAPGSSSGSGGGGFSGGGGGGGGGGGW